MTQCLKAMQAGLLALLGLSGAEHVDAALPSRCAGAVYVANTGEDTLSVIDASRDKVIATLPVGKGPTMAAITRDGRLLYVNNSRDDSISEIDAGTNALIRTIRLPAGTGGSGFALSPDGRRAVVTKLGEPGHAVIVTLATGNVSRPIPVGINSERVAITPDGRRAYVTDGAPKMANGTVTVIDLDTATAIATIGMPQYPFNLVILPDGKRVYVANIFGSSISVIDTATNTVIQTIRTAAYPNGLALSPDARRIYMTHFTGGTMQILDVASGTVSAPVPTSKSPSYLTLTPDGRQAYYVHPLGNTVSVVDTATLGVANSITVGERPTSLTVCPFAGGRRTVAAALPPAPAGARRGAMSISTTEIGVLLDDPAARSIVDKHIPGFSTDKRVSVARSMTFQTLQIVGAGVVSNAQLAAIDADLAKLGAK